MQCEEKRKVKTDSNQHLVQHISLVKLDLETKYFLIPFWSLFELFEIGENSGKSLPETKHAKNHQSKYRKNAIDDRYGSWFDWSI